MNATKLFAFFLMLATVAALLFFGIIAGSAPFDRSLLPPLLREFPSGCLVLVLFAGGVPVAVVPGIAGLGLWLLVVRRQETAAEQAVTALPGQEAFFQDRLDRLTWRLLEVGDDTAAMAMEIPLWTRDLDEPRQARLLRFLAECGGDVSWQGSVPLFSTGGGVRQDWSGWNLRALSLGLLAFSAFCFLWSGLSIFTYLATDLGRLLQLVLGVEPGPTMVVGAMGCCVPALTALLGGLGLRWLLRREASRRNRGKAFQNRAGEIILESCLNRIRRLLAERDGAPSATIRIARASAVSALADLDVARKGRLIALLHAGNFLSSFTLTGIDLRGAVFAETELSGISLPAADLSGALLAGVRLVRADLHGSRLRGADLRRADVGETNLCAADLRGARLHQCSLRKADLRGANLEGAYLWQTDLTEADLAGARITAEQLTAARAART